MAQRYFSVDNERSARKVALLCCGLFFVGAFLWFIPPMAMRVVYPDLRTVWPSLANPSEGAYAVASLTLLPHGLIGVMLAAMFSATMANLSAQFNLKSAILSKDLYQALLRKNAGDRELLIAGWVSTFFIGGATTVIAAIMAGSGQSVFQIMLTFNTLMSLAYGPPALLGLAVRRTPPWSGLASFAVGLFLEHALRSGRHASPCATFPESQYSDRRRQGIEGLSGFHRPRISLSKPDDILHRIVEPVAAVRRSGGSERHGVVICRSYFVRRRIFALGARPRECNGRVRHEWQQHATGIAAGLAILDSYDPTGAH